ncbi:MULTISPECIES: DUF6233 domain-containing protein [unclassified Streptomyces]|uniref:DUF6233 domain-containing protein n=1 Tax=unclassified Streptomyces TaxID=2593676 RepID=UPI000B80D909|nr:DUF6233 domain-containing protein [Streptomyces sp. LcepLS]MYR28615.1 hypothetical protein [Streptomyces sp. SID4945]
MSEPSRLDLLRFAYRVVEQQARASLAQIAGWIAAEEQREREVAAREARRPAPPEWVAELSIGRDRRPILVHTGGCHMIGKRSRGIDRDAALRALDAGVEACPHCRPDTALGWMG